MSNPNPGADPYRPYTFSYYVRQTALLGTMVGVLMLCADVGFAQAHQYSLQSTANMAAIVGAHELPNRNAAANAAATYMRSNGIPNPEDKVVVVGEALVAVDMTETYEPFFAKWLGLKRVPLRAYAQEQKL